MLKHITAGWWFFPKALYLLQDSFFAWSEVDGGFGIPQFYRPNTTQDQISGPSRTHPVAFGNGPENDWNDSGKQGIHHASGIVFSFPIWMKAVKGFDEYPRHWRLYNWKHGFPGFCHCSKVRFFAGIRDGVRNLCILQRSHAPSFPQMTMSWGKQPNVSPAQFLPYLWNIMKFASTETEPYCYFPSIWFCTLVFNIAMQNYPFEQANHFF